MLAVPTFLAPDATVLNYHLQGAGRPVVCLPGGPMQDTHYLTDLGGLAAHRQLIMLDPRGTGQSAIPADPTSYRCDRQVGDVEALRQHLGLDQMDLLAHCAGANLATLYAAHHPDRVSRLALITPSTFAAGIAATGAARLPTARLRHAEPWYPPAFAAFEAIVAGTPTPEAWDAITPFFYGRWDTATQSYAAAHARHRNDQAAATFGSDGAYDPDTTRAALATFPAPVLLLAGEYDLNTIPTVVAEFADLFPHAEFTVQPGAGHFPWLDDADAFVKTTATFLH
jgi:proline iminopeptidase